MAEEIPEWRSKWDAECPLMIGVAYTGWESGSDAGLREELKRIHETGFTAVRVRFDREGDIEKMAGMVNWRNPDRFFDAAEKAGLKVWCAPGSKPHRSIERTNAYNDFFLSPIGLENVRSWLRRFCGQYSAHPALQAWVLEEDDAAWFDYEASTAQAFRREGREQLWKLFQEADPTHPIVTITGNLLAPLPFALLDSEAPSPPPGLFGASVQITRDFEIVSGEFDCPLFTLASLTASFTPPSSIPAIAECTSGTSRYSGKRAFTMSEGKVTRLLLLFLAAGMKSIGFDTWKAERGDRSKEEGGLTDWLNRVTPHAQAAGRIAQAVERYRFELWHSASTPMVSVLCAPLNDIIAQRRGNDYASDPPLARVGAARCLLNANVPFAFITDQQIITDSAATAPVVFLPGMETLSEPLLLKLTEYATNGGRVVADMPTGYLNANGELLDTRPGSAFEQLFGASVAGLFQFNNPAMKEAEPQRGQTRANLVTTTARAGGGTGETPAFTENRVGKGRAVLINLSLSRLNAAPALQNAQLSLLSYILGSKQTALPGLTGCLVFRRMSEQAEHVFLLNDSGEERTTELAMVQPFTQAQDAITEESLPIENNAVSITVSSGSGRWVRLAK